jgi:hypothetical protein
VLERGGDIDQAVAGFLHDSLEDVISPEERRGRRSHRRHGPGAGFDREVNGRRRDTAGFDERVGIGAASLILVAALMALYLLRLLKAVASGGWGEFAPSYTAEGGLTISDPRGPDALLPGV